MLRLIHVFDLFDSKNAHDNERKAKAQASWEVLHRNKEHHVIQVTNSHPQRISESIGDFRKLPFFKDVVENGIGEAISEDDIIFWSNDDSWLHPTLPDALVMHCAIHQCGTAHRREFDKIPSQTMAPEQLVGISRSDMGRDCIFATKRWWLKNWGDIGDFILATPDFDLCMAALIRKQKGFTTTRQNLYERIPSCELPLGLICHELHTAVWRGLSEGNSAIMHNRKCFIEWRDKFAPEIIIPI